MAENREYEAAKAGVDLGTGGGLILAVLVMKWGADLKEIGLVVSIIGGICISLGLYRLRKWSQRLRTEAARRTLCHVRPTFHPCPSCASKPGSPTLCRECLERRELHDTVRPDAICPICRGVPNIACPEHGR